MDKYITCVTANKAYRFLAIIPVLAGMILLMQSCAPTKPSYYFKTIQKDTTVTGMVNRDLESKISKGDLLKIVITSLSREEDVIYNVSPAAGSGSREGGFAVEQDGNIMVHKIGQVRAIGLTRKELAEELKKRLAPYLKDPVVTVQYINHKVTVMGRKAGGN